MSFTPTDTPPVFAERLWQAYFDDLTSGIKLPSLTRQAFLAAALVPAFEYHAAMFDIGPDNDAVSATYLFLIQVQERVAVFPPSWFDLFHRASLEGTITRAAWGAAARMTYTNMPPKLRGGFASNRYLQGFRFADPTGLMLPPERATLASQPDVVTLYRGAVASCFQDAVAGLNWTFSFKDAQLGIFRRRMGFYGPQTCDGREYILRALIPRAAILGILHRPHGEGVAVQSYGSVLVDFEMIDRASAKSLAVDQLHVGILGSMMRNVAAIGSCG